MGQTGPQGCSPAPAAPHRAAGSPPGGRSGAPSTVPPAAVPAGKPPPGRSHFPTRSFRWVRRRAAYPSPVAGPDRPGAAVPRSGSFCRMPPPDTAAAPETSGQIPAATPAADRPGPPCRRSRTAAATQIRQPGPPPAAGCAARPGARPAPAAPGKVPGFRGRSTAPRRRGPPCKTASTRRGPRSGHMTSPPFDTAPAAPPWEPSCPGHRAPGGTWCRARRRR